MNSAVYFFMNQLPRLPTENCRPVGISTLLVRLLRCGNARAGCMLLFEAPDAPCLASGTSGSTTLRVRERRVLNLLVEIAPFVVTNKVRTDVFVAGAFGGLRLVVEAIVERPERSGDGSPRAGTGQPPCR